MKMQHYCPLALSILENFKNVLKGAKCLGQNINDIGQQLGENEASLQFLNTITYKNVKCREEMPCINEV